MGTFHARICYHGQVISAFLMIGVIFVPIGLTSLSASKEVNQMFLVSTTFCVFVISYGVFIYSLPDSNIDC
jgi:hypothetical protein